MVCGRVDRLVKLARPSHRRALGRLRHGSHDSSRRINHASRLHPSELASVLADNIDHAYPRMHQQYAYEMDCEFQFLGVDVQYHCVVYCSYIDTCVYESRGSGFVEIYAGRSGLGEFLCWDGFSEWGCAVDDFCGCYLDYEVGYLTIETVGHV